MRTTRLFVEQDLGSGATVGLESAQSHYLQKVLRLGAGDPVHLFNGRDGEWRGRIDGVGRGWCSVSLVEKKRDQEAAGDLWLVFAPVKRARIDFIAAKATELGVSALVPVFTEHTDVARVNEERLRANAVEASEQCGRLTVPAVHAALPFEMLMRDWPADRRLMVCDETGDGAPVADVLDDLHREKGGGNGSSPWAVMTGPEGGFSAQELDLLSKSPIVTRVGLGPRILRADTAAVAALACWQAVLGDWRD